MPMLRLAYARACQPRRLRLSDSAALSLERLSTSGAAAPGRPQIRAREPLPENVFRHSADRLRLALEASPRAAGARIFAYEAAYILLAAAAGCHDLAFTNAPSKELAAQGAAALCLPREDRELAQALACIYRIPGWEELDLPTVLEFVDVVTSFARRFGAPSSQLAFQTAACDQAPTDFRRGDR